MFFHPRVKSWTTTCFSHPTQVEIELKNGKFIYFRYRGGIVRIGCGDTMDDAVKDAMDSKATDTQWCYFALSSLVTDENEMTDLQWQRAVSEYLAELEDEPSDGD